MRADLGAAPRHDGHWLDRAFARLSRGAGLFAQGWGDVEAVAAAGLPGGALQDVPVIDVKLGAARRLRGGLRLSTGTFSSPIADQLPGEAKRAVFWWLRPAEGVEEPVWLHMAGTGEGGHRRRLHLARPLAQQGIGSVILENPYYGARAPSTQRGNNLAQVADLLCMCRGAVGEGRALLRWLGERGHRHRGVCGYSMGGQIAAIVAATVEEPVACAVMAAGQSAVPIFCRDALSSTICWRALGADPRRARERLASLIALADLDRFPMPQRPDAAILLGVARDGYVRPRQVRALHELWSGSELRWVGGGHVGTWLRRGPLVAVLHEAIGRL